MGKIIFVIGILLSILLAVCNSITPPVCNCLVDPCYHHECALGEVCVPDYCNGCTHKCEALPLCPAKICHQGGTTIFCQTIHGGGVNCNRCCKGTTPCGPPYYTETDSGTCLYLGGGTSS